MKIYLLCIGINLSTSILLVLRSGFVFRTHFESYYILAE
jgi:hypothetical protein